MAYAPGTPASLGQILLLLIFLLLGSSALYAQDHRQSGNHRAPGAMVLFPGLTGQELLDSLVANYKPAAVLAYGPARDTLFANIYNVADSLGGVYAGFTIYLNPAADPTTDAAAKGIDTEHTWPQSKGAGSGNARSDMHHLFPVKSTVNSARGNKRLSDIPDVDTDAWYRKDVVLSSTPATRIDEYAENDNGSDLFEPREVQKGNSARACFYFYAMYRSEADAADPTFFDLQKNDLRDWHNTDPADSAEMARNDNIALYQDNRANPFIIDATLVDRAYFSSGTNVPPNNLSFSSISETGFQISWDLPTGYIAAENQVFILMQQDAAVDDDPTGADVGSYTASSSFGSGSQVGSGSYCVYSGDGTSVTISGLTANTVYHVKIWNTQNGTTWSTTQTSGSQLTAGGSVGPGDIIISEFLQNPSAVTDANGEWLELYNTTNAPIDINGWILRDDDTDSHTITNGISLLVPAGGFLVLGIDDTYAVNGGVTVDYQYNNFLLANGADEIVLLLGDGNTEIDRVNYDGGPLWPDPNGRSSTYAGTPGGDNNDPANWIEATEQWPGSAGDFGSPGENGPDQILPVRLSGFTAGFNESGILLQWRTASELNNQGFRVYRAVDESNNFQRIAGFESDETLAGQGTSNQSHLYRYLDKRPLPNAWHRYRLVDVDYSGRTTWHPQVLVFAGPGQENFAETFQLYQNYPNPFNPATRISYRISDSGFVELSIFDVAGRKVRNLVSEKQAGGLYSISWDGRSDSGLLLSSGLYYYRLQIGAYSDSKKMLLLR